MNVASTLQQTWSLKHRYNFRLQFIPDNFTFLDGTLFCSTSASKYEFSTIKIDNIWFQFILEGLKFHKWYQKHIQVFLLKWGVDRSDSLNQTVAAHKATAMAIESLGCIVFHWTFKVKQNCRSWNWTALTCN